MSSPRVRMPADIELEDKLAFGLTARQLLLLAATALPAYGVFSLTSTLLPPSIAVALTVPLALAGAVLALGRRDGLSGDQYALAIVQHLIRPRRRLLAPEGIPAPLAPSGQVRRARLELPVRSIRRGGLVEVADGSFCIVLRASSAAFALRSDEEQEALVAGFAHFLNGLLEPVQLIVRSEPVDLDTNAREVLETASTIDNPALREAASGYSRFLSTLAADEDVRRRKILLVLSTRTRGAAAELLQRRSREAIELLRAAGVELQPLDGDELAQLLARTLDPPGPPNGSRLEGVIRRS